MQLCGSIDASRIGICGKPTGSFDGIPHSRIGLQGHKGRSAYGPSNINYDDLWLLRFNLRSRNAVIRSRVVMFDLCRTSLRTPSIRTRDQNSPVTGTRRPEGPRHSRSKGHDRESRDNRPDH